MNKKSFTLIELLVVIAIIGILSSLVIARFSDWGEKARIANTLQWSAGVHRTLGANLVGHWPLNEGSGTTFNDISGYENHGDCEGDYCPSWTESGIPGTGNPALIFDGNDDYVDAGGNDSLFPTNQVSWGFWTYVNSAGTGTHRYYLWERYSSPYGLLLFIRDSNSEMEWYLGNGSILEHTSSDNAIPTEQWVHVAGTYDGITMKLYVNGTLQQHLANLTGPIVYTGTDNFIISTYSRPGINGRIDDIRIYDAALATEEVSRMYTETKDKYLVYE